MADPTPTPPVPAPATTVHAPATPLRTGLGLLLPLLAICSLLLVLLGAVAGGLFWLLGTQGGSSWLLTRLPFVQLEGFRGAVLGPDWQAERLRVQWDGGRQWILIEGLRADGLRWQWQPHDHAAVAVTVKAMTARSVTLHTGPASQTAVPLPKSLAPPVHFFLDSLRVERFLLDGHAPALGLQLSGLQLDPRPGARHAVERVEFAIDALRVAGAASLANETPYALAAKATVLPANGGEAPPWAAVIDAKGTLSEVALEATLRGRASARSAAPALDLRAGLRPLQPWLLASLQLQTQALDLSALLPRAPSTLLSGQATLKGGDKGSLMQVQVALANAVPGRWNERRLPVRRLVLDMGGKLQQPERLELTRFDLLLADAGATAGRWSGTGVWAGHTLSLDTRLQDLTPQRLDGRAAAMTVTGPLALTVGGLPSPDFRVSTAPPPPAVSWKLDLQGRLDGAPQTVQLQLEGRADDDRFELSRASAQAGSASLALNASLVRAERGEWKFGSSGTVNDFDPLPWWPGDANSPWRKGPHRVSGEWQLDLRLPRNAEKLQPLLLAQRVAGNGTLRLQRSVLAGVPLSADLTLGYAPAAAPAPASLRAELQVGGNRVRLEGRGDPTGSGSSDTWRVALDAGTLASLAPLARLHPATAAWAPTGGAAELVLAADGRWPDMQTQGKLTASLLKLGPFSLARGAASWRLATLGDQALDMQLDLAGVGYERQRADHLRAQLRGTLAEHQIELSTAMPLLPPNLAVQMLGIQAQSGTQAQMRASGQWRPASTGGGRWKAGIERLVVGSWDGGGADAPPASSWIEASELRTELDFDARGHLLALTASPGRVRLADSVAMRWDEVRIDLRGELPLLWLRADIEPFALAPLLARAQPEVGWQGDLRLSARVDIRAAEKMDADLVFERADGDLHITGQEGTQLLGLTNLRLAVSAHDGVWNFAPSFAGRSIGELSGQVKAQSTPERRWPLPASPIEGMVRSRVADIGIWGAWVPPGWRLAGELTTTASLSGSFGQPLFTGQVEGKGLAVRNLLQGVNVSDGQVLVTLAGDTAKVERFTLRAGDGNASITGSATLDAKPRARLQFKAERLRVLGRVDRQVIASGNAELVLDGERTALDGKFRIDEGLYDASSADAPTLDEDVSVRDSSTAAVERRAPAEATGTRRSFALGVDVDLGEKLRLRGRGLETGLTGQVRLTNPGGRLAVNGTITTESGTYAAYGQKLEIERGIVAFTGIPDNPRLDVLALRPNIDQRVGVAITGYLLTPRIRLFAEPELSDSEKLSWLVLGRAPDGLGRNDTALLQRAAVALLSGEGEAPTDALMRSLGIDEVSLRQGDGDVRETVITVGKQLSRRWYLGYERGVNATTGTWQLIYRIAQRFTLRAQSGVENALDLIWTWRLQETPADAGMRKSRVTPP